jgi:predicted transcriptional regulator
MYNPMKIRDAIATIIRESPLTQSEWARRSQMSRQALCDYLAGRKDLVGDRIQKLLWAMDSSQKQRFIELIAQSG